MALGDAFPGVSGGPDSVETRKALSGLVIRNSAGAARAGIFPRHANSLLTARADMKVDIAAFEGVSVRGGGPHFMANDGTVQSALLTVPVSNSILHVIYFKQNESASPFADANDSPIFGVLSSAPAAIPSKPDLSTIPGAVELGTVLVPAGKTATNQSGVVITATHQFTTTAGGLLWFRNTTEMNDVTDLPQHTRAIVLANNQQYVFSGTAWLLNGFFHVQRDTTNSVEGMVTQYGMGRITGANSAAITELVTFPVAFASVPFIHADYMGVRPSGAWNPAGLTDFSPGTVGKWYGAGFVGFTMQMHRDDGVNLATGWDFYYSWSATGVLG